MKRNWFQRLLLSYLPVLILIACLFIFISIVQLKELSSKEATKSSRMYLQNLMTSMDVSLKSIDNLMVESIARNNKFISFAGMENDPEFILELTRLLQSLTASHPFIDSAYVYRSGDDSIVSNETKLIIDQFADREYVRQSLEAYGGSSWSEPRKFKIWNEWSSIGNDEKTVISMARGIPLQGKRIALLVVNVRISVIHDFLRDNGTSEINDIAVLDSRGEALFEQSGQAVRGKIRLQSDYTGWTYHSGLKTRGLYSITNYITSGWFLFGFLGLLSAIGWIVYIARKNYKPIETMMSRIEKYNLANKEHPIQGLPADELSYIDYTLSSIMEATQDYEHQTKENQSYRRLQLFKELMEEDSPVNREEWEAELAALGLNEWGTASIAIVEIDKYMEFISTYSRKDQGLFKYILRKVVEETAKTGGLIIWQEWMTNHRLCVLYLYEGRPLQAESAAVAHMEQVRQWLQENLKMTVTVGIGNAADSPEAIPQSYELAARALDYKSALGSNRLIGHWEIELLSHDDLFIYLQYVRTIAQAFRVGNDGWQEQLRLLFEGLRGLLLPKEEINGILTYMNYYFYREMMELPPEYQELWNREFGAPWSESMENLETLDELEAFYLNALSACARKMEAIRESKGNHGVVQQVRVYIEENFSNPDLSLSLLSDQFHMNASSLSTLFKEEFGEKFVVYLCQVRMEHAKELLRSTSLPIQEIAEKVGYLHQMSFIRAFKKMIGTTPGDYRKVHQ
ncbi:helix-turn-helix domain-containing protein [Paenibacillus sp. YN15]|uniref:helix-turn-helix domain-containing protein n=1 Tax=Paenibacillus sp. YN15 TaxID=1742774 RepID=UPI000DCD03B6|nr:helix-turn-helix domain-containing protein [Paenibacillus sp. YN15]RAU93300.1 hypothetical protein DQG13_25895 [Paenibacillus sp. YN15]